MARLFFATDMCKQERSVVFFDRKLLVSDKKMLLERAALNNPKYNLG